MLAERIPKLESCRDALTHCPARLLGGPQYCRHRVGYRLGIGHRGKFENPDPVREFVLHTRGCFQRQPGLSHPADSYRRVEPSISVNRNVTTPDGGWSPVDTRTGCHAGPVVLGGTAATYKDMHAGSLPNRHAVAVRYLRRGAGGVHSWV